ncbi:MAG: zf-HC2 domain-containing protein, partial [Candidatus Dormibacteria bacterium]
MKCSLLTLSCALDGELSRERQSELEAHLVTCERCRTGMRYLREETDRISQLARVAVSGSTATALLERARVVAAPEPAAEAAPADIPPAGEHPGAADPFSLMGIGTQLVPAEDLGDGSITEAPASDVEAQPAEPATGAFPSDLEAGSPIPTDSDEFASAAAPQAGEIEPASEVGSGESSPGQDATEVADGLDGAEAPDAAAEAMAEPENPSQGEEQLPVENAGSGGGTLAEENPVAGVWQVGQEALWAVPDTSVIPPDDPPSEPISDQDAPLVQEPEAQVEAPPARNGGQEDSWLGSGSEATPLGSADGEGPPPLFLPFRHPSSEGARPAAQETGWPIIQGPSPEPEPEPQPASEPASDSDTSSAPGPTTRQSDEVMQVALEESALLGELSALDRVPPGYLPSMPEEIDAPSIPPPPSIGGDGGPADRGWEPSTSLDLGLGGVAAAQPTMDLLGLGRQPPSETPPPADSWIEKPAGGFPSTTRPSESVAAVTGSSATFRSESVRRSVAAPRARRQPPSGPRQSAPPRSWTKTATIAIAALAVFLIGWSLLHHTSKPASPPPT